MAGTPVEMCYPISVAQIQKATGSTKANAELYHPHLLKYMRQWDITTPKRIVAFLAQVAVETGGLKAKVESLYYTTPERLKQVFGKYFTDAELPKFLKNSEKVANRVYGNRMGNGNESSGDGFKYRGRGWIQITGKNNYRAIGMLLGLDLVKNPELVETPAIAVAAACAFWYLNGLNELADKDMQTAISKQINLGNKNSKATPNHLKERLEAVNRCKTVFGFGDVALL